MEIYFVRDYKTHRPVYLSLVLSQSRLLGVTHYAHADGILTHTVIQVEVLLLEEMIFFIQHICLFLSHKAYRDSCVQIKLSSDKFLSLFY